MSLGRGTAKGNGSLKLVGESAKIVTVSLDFGKQEAEIINKRSIGAADLPQGEVSNPEAEIVNKKCQLRIPETAAHLQVRRVHFDLSCPGPFLSHDPSRNVVNQDNVLFALRRNSDQPVLWPESLYGVLRERCALASGHRRDQGRRQGR